MDLTDLTDATRLNVALAEKLIEATEVAGPFDLKAVVDFLVAARELKALVGDVARIAEDMVVEAMGDKRTTTFDGRTVEVRRSYKRTDWEHSKLAMHVALRATGGELIDQMPEVIDALLKACNPSWRVTALKEMGLDDTDYCSRELQRATVAVM
jgi:hypothetical protein